MALTPQEQLMLELINRARANPSAEAARFGISLNDGLAAGTIGKAAKQPLAANAMLQRAAEGHSAWMLATDTFSHTGKGGSSPGDRIDAQGYDGWTWGENISWVGSTGSLDRSSAIVAQHEDLFLSAGHRVNLLREAFAEAGVAQELGSFQGYNASMVTQNFAARYGDSFLLGVAIDDRDNDDFYDIGEGLGGVTVTATGGGRSFTTTTTAAGGYELRLPDGSYQVTWSGGALDGTVTRSVTVGALNVKLDVELDDAVPGGGSGGGTPPGEGLAQVAEVLQISLGTGTATLKLSRAYDNPVVIAQAPGANGADPVAVRVHEAAGDRLRLSLQEPNYLDGNHPSEAVTVLVVEAGQHLLADGTRLEAGTLDSKKLSPQGFEAVDFATDFAARPVILSQVQSFNGSDFVVTRQRGADRDGFQLTMQEEEAKNGGGHATETLGWVAVEAGTGDWSGLAYQAGTTGNRVTDAGASQSFAKAFGAAPGVLTSMASFDGADPAMLRLDRVDARGFDVRVQEEASADSELDHATEAVDFLAFGGEARLWASGTSGAGGLAAGQGRSVVIGEVGRVSLDDGVRTIRLDHAFDDPVAFAIVTTSKGPDPVVVRIEDVGADSLTMRLQEPDYLDGNHGTEQVSYLVLEAGTHLLSDGTVLEVGARNLSKLTTAGFAEVDFTAGFDARPAVLSQVQTANGPSFVVTRQDDASAQGVSLALEEEEAGNDGGHATERVGYLAIERGAGDWASGADSFVFEAGTTGDRVTDSFASMALDGDFDASPALLASLASFDGPDPAILRIDGLDRDGFAVRLQEDQSADSETGHASESVDFLAIGGAGLLLGDPLIG